MRRILDLAFPLRGRLLPFDHAYSLWRALGDVLPLAQARPHWGIHPVDGVRQGDTLLLDERSTLQLRLGADEIPDVLPLVGARLDVGGHAVELGSPRLFTLQPRSSLQARLVALDGEAGHHDARAFAEAVRARLGAIDGFAQDPARVSVRIGRRRVLNAGDGELSGFAVHVRGLDVPASLALQAAGVGERRPLGAGLFQRPIGLFEIMSRV